ncbi:hypothetical protein [Acidovorax sp. SRB_24]|uniref:hypothetical protein n=1 Tax=Acidovorax sp. SRB_24 TaxID=1962700 RepID=UPI001F0CE461|nr:hypothetical protein [Acidovorax sp. SRB_24]
MAIHEEKLHHFMGPFVQDFGAVRHGATVVVGDPRDLHQALAEGPATAEELARRSPTDVRCRREWLSARAASRCVCYDPASQRFELSEEQACAPAEEGSPAFLPGAFQIAIDPYECITKMVQAMRTGLGAGYGFHVPQSLKPDASGRVIGPFADDQIDDKLTPVGRVVLSASAFICTPASRAQEVGLCLGAQDGEARMRDVGHARRLPALPARHPDAVQPGQ